MGASLGLEKVPCDCVVRNQLGHTLRVLYGGALDLLDAADPQEALELASRGTALAGAVQEVLIDHGLERPLQAHAASGAAGGAAGCWVAVRPVALPGTTSDARALHVPAGASTLFLRSYRGEVTARVCCPGGAWEVPRSTDALGLFEAFDASRQSLEAAEAPAGAALAAEAPAGAPPVDAVPPELAQAGNTDEAAGSEALATTASSPGPLHGPASAPGVQLRATPHECFCPISHELFEDPVLALDGFTYERRCIEEWWSRKGPRSPMTGHEVGTTLTPNLAIRALCDEHRGEAGAGSSAPRQADGGSGGFYAPHVATLAEMFASQLQEAEIRQLCEELDATGVRDVDVCVRQLLRKAGEASGGAGVCSLGPVCCASTAAGITADGDAATAAAVALLDPAAAVPARWPPEKEALFAELLDFHVQPVRARKAIDVGLADTVDEAVRWLERHQDDEDIDTPMEVLRERDAVQLAMDVLRVATVPAPHRLQCFRTLHQILGKILEDPESERLRKIRVQNAAFRDRVLRFQPAVALLRRIGFEQGDYWATATQREPCLEFRLPVDSDNAASQRFVRAYSLIDLVLSSPDEWVPMLAPPMEAVTTEWQRPPADGARGADADDAAPLDGGGRGARPGREFFAELHERRTRDPRGFREAMEAAGARPNAVIVDVRQCSEQEAHRQPSEADAQALAAAAGGAGQRYRRLAERYPGRRAFDLNDIEAMRVGDAIANCPQYAREYSDAQGSLSSYADLLTRSYDPQFLGRKAVDDTNTFRAQQRMPPLRWSQALADIAAEHAKQMARGAMPFSHQGFQDRVARYPFPHLTAAENLAYNGGVADAAGQAVRGWINSPGHRKNLLGAFDLCGVGVAQAASGEFFFNQLFSRTLGGALC